MKTTNFLFLLCFIWIITPCFAQQWTAIGPNDFNGEKGFSAEDVASPSLAVDNSGSPYVSYVDIENGTVLVKKFDLGGWVTVGNTEDEMKGFGNKNQIAIDPHGIPYLVYSDQNDDGKISVKKFDGSNWLNVGAAISNKTVHFSLLAIDASGVPYLAYLDYDSACSTTEMKELKVKKLDGNIWVDTGFIGYAVWNPCGFVTPKPTLKISDSGTPFIAYMDWNSFGKITVKNFNGESWHLVGSPWRTKMDFAPIDNFSMAVPNFENPYLAYSSGIFGNIEGPIEVKKYDGISWNDVGQSTEFTAYGSSVSLVLDASGTPYIAYIDIKNDNKATVRKFDGISWVPVGDAEVSAREIMPYDLAFTIDKADNLILVYKSKYLYAKKFNTRALAVDRFSKLDYEITLYPNPVHENLKVGSNHPINKVEIYTLLGQKMKEVTSNYQSIATKDLVRGIYMVKVYFDHGTMVRKLVKN